MKKIMAILLIVLVAGFVFADDMDYPNAAELTLKSTVYQKVNHGFHGGSAIDNFSAIIDFETVNNTVSGLDMEDSEVQAAGFYSFASNSSVGVRVSVKTAPLKLADQDIYVPYDLTFEKVLGSVGLNQQSDGAYSMLNEGSGHYATASATYGVEKDLLILSGPSSLRWGSFVVRVKFDGGSNKTDGLPQGSYTGVVTATITAQ